MLVDPTENNNKGLSVLIEAGGGCASAFNIESYRTMSIDQFKEHIVPTLKSTPAEDRFFYYVLRDLSNYRYLTIYPDGVVEYKVDSVHEIPANKLVEVLVEEGSRGSSISTNIINSSLPVYEYGEDNIGRWKMSVKIPETRFKFRNSYFYTDEEQYPYIYMPPVLYTVEASKENVISNSFVKVLVQDSFDAAKCKFGHLALPNIYRSGRICRGRTYLQDSSDAENMSKMRIIASSWDLFINSLWNADLLYDTLFPDNVNEVFDTLESPSDLYKKYSNSKDRNVCKVIEILKEGGRWEQLHWVPM